jgi:hypothetical protein
MFQGGGRFAVGRRAAVGRMMAQNTRDRRDARRRYIAGEEAVGLGGSNAPPPPLITTRVGRQTRLMDRVSPDVESAKRFTVFPGAPGVKGVAAEQEEFDEVIKDAIIAFANPDRDEFRDHELFALLKRSDARFDPTSFGAPSFGLLLRNCKYLDARGGKYHVQREFDAARQDRDITVGLTPFEYRQPAQVDGLRKPPRTVGSSRLRYT